MSAPAEVADQLDGDVGVATDAGQQGAFLRVLLPEHAVVVNVLLQKMKIPNRKLNHNVLQVIRSAERPHTSLLSLCPQAASVSSSLHVCSSFRCLVSCANLRPTCAKF